ncbi:PASTA domain-containing protein, partial [Streptomyces sp. NPDC001852]|uniref:Stk1 family PASTA domain-containing Ser/Thr kinase n=1 Tax=Streptomyces sp. NPDC001852 TaxID=3364619 RepID=UPI0036A51028
KDPNYRYQSADEMRADIEACLDGQPVAATAAMGAVGYGGYPDDQPTTALRPDAGAGATSMLPPMNPDDGGYGYDEGPGRRGRQQKKSNTSTILLVVAGILVLIGAILIGKWVASNGNTGNGKVPVPTFVGQPLSTARNMADNVDLKVSVTRKPCDDQAKGNVCAQDPTPKTEVDKGSTINLTVSTGAPKVAVPNVLGQNFDDAKATLEGDKYKFDVVRKDEVSTQPVGTVIKQNPDLGIEVQKGSKITLTVAKAADKVTIPNDVVGKSCDDAKAELTQLGLAPSSTCTETPTTNQDDDGKVLSTNPAVGSQVDKNTPVVINVGKFQASQPTQVPNVTTQPLKQAQQILQQQGFTQIQVNGPNDDKARVISQTPPAGTQADPSNTQIVLTTVDIGGGNGGGGFLGGNNG